MKFKSKLFLFSAAALLGAFGMGALVQQPDIYFLIKKNFNIFSEAYENVAIEYVDEVNPEILMRNGMNAMLETLDPYTVLFDEAENEQSEILSRGNYAGIGIEAGFRDGQIVVIAPTEGSPAELAGIRAGDIIIEVDGVATEGLSPEEAQVLTLGENGSSVNLKITRYGSDQVFEFNLVREVIEISNIGFAGMVGENEDVGYIKLNQFGFRSADEIRTEIEKFNDNGATGIVLDLRDNPGGILQEAVRIVDKFIEPGVTVVETRGRIAEYNEAYMTQEPILFDKPVVVLMNGGSASASEVVAGALQDLDRAVIVGEQSFGKGLVQIVKPMPYNTSLKITISRYYTPSGRSIQSLQYMHSSKSTPVTKADSLLRTYKTKNGREVIEGRGIIPDVELLTAPPSLLQTGLLQQSMYFDFATRYKAENATFDQVSLSDATYNEFLAFLQSADFEYQTPSDIALARIQSELPDSDKKSEGVQYIQDGINRYKSNQLDEEEEEIRQRLFEELLFRYNGRSARVQEMLAKDEQLINAIQLIKTPDQLNNLLSLIE